MPAFNPISSIPHTRTKDEDEDKEGVGREHEDDEEEEEEDDEANEAMNGGGSATKRRTKCEFDKTTRGNDQELLSIQKKKKPKRISESENHPAGADPRWNRMQTEVAAQQPNAMMLFKTNSAIFLCGRCLWSQMGPFDSTACGRLKRRSGEGHLCVDAGGQEFGENCGGTPSSETNRPVGGVDLASLNCKSR